VNFSLHFIALRQRSTGAYWRDPEFRAYLVIMASFVAAVTAYLYATGTFDTVAKSLRFSMLQVVSMQTSTGFVTANFANWPGALPALLILMTFIGGCAGSTGGGMKVIRWLLVSKQGTVELRRLVHPSAEIPVKLANRPVPPRVLSAVTGFFAIYLVLFGGLMLLLMVTGLDQVTAWSAIATTLNNTGPGLGEVAANFRGISQPAQWVCIIAMVAGRLELFTLIILLTPAFWQK
jgi:trk system potassium uptake protein TrkH